MSNRYSSDSTQQEVSNEYQHDRVKMIFIIFCFLVHWTKVTSAAKELSHACLIHIEGQTSTHMYYNVFYTEYASHYGII